MPPLIDSPLHQLVRQFLEYLEVEKNRSLKTINNYNFYLGRFLNWGKPQGIVVADQITNEIVRQYRLWLNRLQIKNTSAAQNRELKKNTQNYHLIALRSF